VKPTGWLAAIVLSALSAVVARDASAQAPAVWQGTLFLSQMTEVCISQGGWTPNMHFVSEYRPKLSNSEQPAAIALFQQRWAGIMTVRGGNGRFRRQGLVEWQQIGPRAAIYGQDAVRYRNFRTTPATVRRNTLGVVAQGRIFDFSGVPGCNVTFVAGYVRRP